MARLSANNLVKAISALNKNVDYEYVSPATKGRIRLIDARLPEGPVSILRYDPREKGALESAKMISISTDMIWRLANALNSNQPVNVDRVFGASYNTRSVLESLLAHTPQFSMCYPGRVQQKNDRLAIKEGHKHIWWTPDDPHELGKFRWVKTGKTISEVPIADVTYEAIELAAIDRQIPEGVQRRHAQIQIALLHIGKSLGFQNTVAKEDQSIKYKGRALIELDSVVSRPGDLQQLKAYPDAIEKIRHIDVAWFKNGRLMPAAIEIEHSTGIKSGLDRLKGLQDALPPFPVRYTIVADESEQEKVERLVAEERFKSLNAKFFSYQTVEELYSLCVRRELRGVTEEFLDSFMVAL